jgi:hypothetical protein
MTLQRLRTRLQRVEQAASPQRQREGTLVVWRLPGESEAEALARCGVDMAGRPHAQLSIPTWFGGRWHPRLAEPPRPVWIPKHQPPGWGEALTRGLLKANKDAEAARAAYMRQHGGEGHTDVVE